MKLFTFILVFLISFQLFIINLKAQENSENKQARVAILMYHSIQKAESKIGPYVISPYMLEQDFKYLSENGYKTITTEDLLNFTEYGVPLPEKAVMLTFDDGNYNNVFYAEPLLKKYKMKAVMFVIGDYCEKASEDGVENPNFSYVTWERLAKMSEDNIWDIQSHTWNMHFFNNSSRQGVRRVYGESDEVYETALYDDFERITGKLQEVTGKKPVAFAYPFGYITKEAEKVLKNIGYKLTFSCESGIAVINDSDDLFKLKRLTRFDTASAEKLLINY